MSSAAILLMMGCGGSSSGDNVTQNAFAFETFTDGAASFVALQGSALPQGTDTPITDRSDLPATGGATYDGLMSVGLDNGTADEVLGTVRLTTNFGNNTFTGSAGSFVNTSDEAVNGSLSISNGVFTSSGTTAGTADVNGTIGFAAGTMVVSGTATHGFSGDTGQYNIGAFLDGDGTAQPTVGGPIDVDMAWVTERQ